MSALLGTEILLTTRRAQATEWLRHGHRLLTVETVTEPDRLPGPDQGWLPDPATRTGPWYVRKRLAYVFLRDGHGAEQ